MIAAFPNPLSEPPTRTFVERSRSQIVQWTQFPQGGHFPFSEELELFLADVGKFAQLVR